MTKKPAAFMQSQPIALNGLAFWKVTFCGKLLFLALLVTHCF